MGESDCRVLVLVGLGWLGLVGCLVLFLFSFVFFVLKFGFTLCSRVFAKKHVLPTRTRFGRSLMISPSRRSVPRLMWNATV